MFSFWSGSKGKPMCSLARSHLTSCMYQQVMSSAFQGPLLVKRCPWAGIGTQGRAEESWLLPQQS